MERRVIARAAKAWTRVVRSYAATRCRARVVVLLPIIILSAAWLMERRRPDATMLLDYATACLVIVALRVMDDLADRPRDCPREPARIACQPGAAGPLFVLALLASLAAGSLLLASRSWPALVIVGVAYAMVAGWYGIRDPLQASRLVNAHFVLAKYPLLVVALGVRSGFAWESEAGLAIWLPAMICYLALMLYELWDDRDVRLDPRAAWCWRVEAVGATALLAGWIVTRFR